MVVKSRGSDFPPSRARCGAPFSPSPHDFSSLCAQQRVYLCVHEWPAGRPVSAAFLAVFFRGRGRNGTWAGGSHVFFRCQRGVVGMAARIAAVLLMFRTPFGRKQRFKPREAVGRSDGPWVRLCCCCRRRCCLVCVGRYVVGRSSTTSVAFFLWLLLGLK